MTYYVYLPAKGGDPATVGYYDPGGQWCAESDHDTNEDAAKRVRFLNGGKLMEGEWHLTVTPGFRVCGNDEPNSSSTDKISNVTCLECLRLKALALAPNGISIAEAVQLMRKAVPDTRLSIEFEMNFTSNSEEVTVDVMTWNGDDHFHGPTLKAAVELLLLKEGAFTGTKEEADRILREALEYQK